MEDERGATAEVRRQDDVPTDLSAAKHGDGDDASALQDPVDTEVLLGVRVHSDPDSARISPTTVAT
ncbi:MAG: hypothetical protein ACRDQ1_15830, partial [Sciscionella sp.]